MKFNDGFWLLKNGVKAFYGLQVVDSKIENDSFILQVASKPVKNRGDTLGGPILTVKLDAPTEGVIGVSISHLSVSVLTCWYFYFTCKLIRFTFYSMAKVVICPPFHYSRMRRHYRVLR